MAAGHASDFSRGTRVLVAGLMATAAVASGCATGQVASEADQNNPTYQAAQKEGQVTWYTALDPTTSKSFIAAFNARYPDIQVNLLRLTSGQLTSRYSQERSAGPAPADVVTTGDDVFEADARQQGWFESSLELPNLASWPDAYYTEGSAKVSIIPLGIAYNTDIVDTPPSDWEDLLTADYVNQLQLGDPRNVPAYIQLAYLLRQKYGDDLLSRVRAQNPTVAPSIVNANQTIAAGGTRAVLPGTYSLVEELATKGAPIGFAQPDTTVGVEFRTMISAGSANPNAARLFMDFMLGPDGQRAMNVRAYSPLGEEYGAVPLPADFHTIPTSEMSGSEKELIALLGLQ